MVARALEQKLKGTLLAQTSAGAKQQFLDDEEARTVQNEGLVATEADVRQNKTTVIQTEHAQGEN